MPQSIAIALLILSLLAVLPGCTLASPFDRLLAAAETATVTPVRTLQPTFTVTPVPTHTPTVTPTSTLTPLPTSTPTPKPSATPTATTTPTITPTFTPAPPTKTPLPTDTPTPSWDYRLAEMFNAPTNSTLMSIVVAVQTNENSWIPGLRVVGIDPNGLVTKSEPTADKETGHTPAGSSVVKAGNTKFEPQPVAVFIDGLWTFHLETVDGRQVSADFTITVDVNNRQWYFFRFTPGG